MTANSEWEEVVQTTRCLSQREQAMNCADLMKRVFDLKKKQLMREIFYGGMYDIFGKCLACGRSKYTRSGDSSWDRDGELATAGPCAGHNSNVACMENSRCIKKYSRPFSYRTSKREDGYPLYRRRDRPETSFDRMVQGT